MGYGKLYDREIYEFNDKYNERLIIFTCYTQNTSYGFRHICTLGWNNATNAKYIKQDIVAKISYYNRTWEHYKYQTVLRQAIHNIDIDKNTKKLLLKVIED